MGAKKSFPQAQLSPLIGLSGIMHSTKQGFKFRRLGLFYGMSEIADDGSYDDEGTGSDFADAGGTDHVMASSGDSRDQ